MSKPDRSTCLHRQLPPREASSEQVRLDEVTGGVLHDAVHAPEEIAEQLCLTPFDLQERLKP